MFHMLDARQCWACRQDGGCLCPIHGDWAWHRWVGYGGSSCENGRWLHQAGPGGGAMKGRRGVGLYFSRTAWADVFFRNAVLDEADWGSRACHQLWLS